MHRRRRNRATLAVRQINRGLTTTDCVDSKLGSFWVVCTGFKGCCHRSDCSWCKDNAANKGSHGSSTAPLAASSQPPPSPQSQSSASPRETVTILQTLASTAPSPSPSSYPAPPLAPLEPLPPLPSPPLPPLEPLPPLPSPPIAPENNRRGDAALALPLGIALGAVLPLAFIAAVFFVRRRRRRHNALSPPPPPPPRPPPRPQPPGFLSGFKRRVSSRFSQGPPLRPLPPPPVPPPPPPPAYVERERDEARPPERGSVAGVVELDGEADVRAELP